MGVDLTHDAWNPHDRAFPAESFVTVDELRDVVRQWAFGDVLPPPAVPWVSVPHESVSWFWSEGPVLAVPTVKR
ncbi:hypothetical protein [Actinophytocola oryzae]|uniref:Uncharacterized protein n=1 Tax=Actinophytocola oryzae TaxID=502181 RepID=A0A4R7VHZ9_9PSEU|nr:hypothetical protein [Actinophytocola oryzae]TDV48994.1 hypothetical protein CLV71_108355 [Actinophytocola oryzae]